MPELTDKGSPRSPAPLFRPDPACPACHGAAYLRADDQTMRECACMLRQRAIQYLTPVYGRPGIQWDRGLDPASLRGKDLLVQNASGRPATPFRASYLSLVKAYLLLTGMVLRHHTATPFEIMQCYLTNTQDGRLDALARVDLLVVLFEGDPPNKHYPDVLRTLLLKRRREGQATWVLTHYALSDRAFIERYGEGLAKHIRAAFTDLDAQPPGAP